MAIVLVPNYYGFIYFRIKFFTFCLGLVYWYEYQNYNYR